MLFHYFVEISPDMLGSPLLLMTIENEGPDTKVVVFNDLLKNASPPTEAFESNNVERRRERKRFDRFSVHRKGKEERTSVFWAFYKAINLSDVAFEIGIQRAKWIKRENKKSAFAIHLGRLFVAGRGISIFSHKRERRATQMWHMRFGTESNAKPMLWITNYTN